MAPQESPTPRDPAQWERTPMDTTESSAPHAHPLNGEQDDTVEAHYACLERPCACYDGVVYVGHLTKEDGEEVEVFEAIPCRRCAERS
jgi:hypothetical protein